MMGFRGLDVWLGFSHFRGPSGVLLNKQGLYSSFGSPSVYGSSQIGQP